jgi:hypothetical protein
MPVRLLLRAADGVCRVFSADDPAAPAVETPLAALPTVERLHADPLRQGRALYTALGGDALRARLDASGDPLLLLECDDAAAEVAWEYAASNASLLACDYAALRVVPRRPLPPNQRRPRLLALCADPLEPPPRYRLNFQAEMRALERALNASGRVLTARRVAPVQERLFDAFADGPVLLHLSCHGTTVPVKDDAGDFVDAALQLEDARGRSRVLMGRDLLRRAPRGALRLVVLSACQTAPLARALVQGGVPAALGMQHNFPDPQSDELAAGFWRFLAAGWDLGEAVRQARGAVFAEDPGAAGMLVAYACEDAWGAVFPALDAHPQESIRVSLRRLLVEGFNERELRQLCDDIGLDAEDLRDDTRPELARELVAWCERRGRLAELLVRCRAQRPHLPWPDAAMPAQADWHLAGGTPDIRLGPPGDLRLPSNLVPPAHVLGRDAELLALARLYDERVPAVTVAGTGGMGKTTLAGAFVQRFGWRFRRVLGHTFATSPVDVVDVCRSLMDRLGRAEASDGQERTAEQWQELVLHAVEPDDLVVFDNYESVLAPAVRDAPTEAETRQLERVIRAHAGAIQRLVRGLADRGVPLLLTSRERPAGLPGERLFPPSGALDGLEPDPAAELFVTLSTRARTTEAGTAEGRNALEQQHRRVAAEAARVTEGYPLALALLAGAYDAEDSDAERFLANWPAMLENARGRGLAAHHVTFAAAMERSLATLSKEQIERLLALRPFDFPFFAEAAAFLWGLAENASTNNTQTGEAQDGTSTDNTTSTPPALPAPSQGRGAGGEGNPLLGVGFYIQA